MNSKIEEQHIQTIEKAQLAIIEKLEARKAHLEAELKRCEEQVEKLQDEAAATESQRIYDKRTDYTNRVEKFKAKEEARRNRTFLDKRFHR